MQLLESSRNSIDFVVGLFVIFSAVAVVFIALRAANISDIGSGNGYMVRVQFDHVGSLSSRAPIKSSGVRVGRVKQIEYNNEDFVAETILEIDKQYAFPEDSTFSIVSSNLLGGQYVEIEVGSAEEDLKKDAIVVGNSAIVLEHLISQFLVDKASE
ncbi:MAG: outer membrane lipid asymmetry maintenance protein MlaD [Gammaproteobacteria bacterium WSBS_2016_MAG_OTU1]